MRFPDVPMKIIRMINHAIDNPSIAQKRLQKKWKEAHGGSYYNPYDYLQLGRRSGHRQLNHDFKSASFVGYKLYGVIGAQIAWFHVYCDYQSDMMRLKYGRKNRDKLEFFFNYYHQRV